MIINLEWERNLEKMFAALLKEKFNQWSNRYDPKEVFKVWAETMESNDCRSQFKRVGWKTDLTIREALEKFDAYCQGIEKKIREKEEGK